MSSELPEPSSGTEQPPAAHRRTTPESVEQVESLRSRTLNAVVALGVLAALFVALNVLAGPWLRGVRVDLTEDQRYTLSDGTREILRDLGTRGPSRLTFFYSREAAAGRPQIQAYAARINELLDEFELAAGGSLRIERVDPKPFSEAEARAQAAGVAALPIGSDGQALFMGLEASGPTDLRDSIAFFDPAQESFLEYELAKLLVTVRSPLRPTVGVISSLPLQRGADNRPWLIWQELSLRFDLELLGQDFSTIDPAVRALLIVHPKGLSDAALQAIDAAATSGMPLVVLYDPVCELDRAGANERNPMAAMQADRSSDLGNLLERWGANIDTQSVAGDLNLAARVRSRGEAVAYLPYLQLTFDQFDQNDPATRQIESMILASAGSIVPVEGATTELTPLIQTTDRSSLIDSLRITPMTDPRELVDAFVSRGSPLTLAARLRGPVEPPESAASTGNSIDVLLIADADLLADRFWLEEVGFGGASLGYRRLSDNGDLILNAVELAAGDRSLLSLRGRGTVSRPFTRIADLQKRADEQYATELKALEAKRDEVEEQLRLVQQGDPEMGADNQLILTPEQEARVESFRAELVETNRRLREVRFNLNEDVDRLEATTKLINTAGGPLLVTFIAIVLFVVRRGRFAASRRRLQQAAA